MLLLQRKDKERFLPDQRAPFGLRARAQFLARRGAEGAAQIVRRRLPGRLFSASRASVEARKAHSVSSTSWQRATSSPKQTSLNPGGGEETERKSSPPACPLLAAGLLAPSDPCGRIAWQSNGTSACKGIPAPRIPYVPRNATLRDGFALSVASRRIMGQIRNLATSRGGYPVPLLRAEPGVQSLRAGAADASREQRGKSRSHRNRRRNVRLIGESAATVTPPRRCWSSRRSRSLASMCRRGVDIVRGRGRWRSGRTGRGESGCDVARTRETKVEREKSRRATTSGSEWGGRAG